MQQFRQAIEKRDLNALMSLFTDDVVFRSPVTYRPFEGREQVETVLTGVMHVLEDFRYTRAIGDPEAADSALVFEARVGDREVEGCDFIHVNEDGLIDELFVMFRPLSGVMAMAEAMKRQLGLDAPSAA